MGLGAAQEAFPLGAGDCSKQAPGRRIIEGLVHPNFVSTNVRLLECAKNLPSDEFTAQPHHPTGAWALSGGQSPEKGWVFGMCQKTYE